MFTRRRFLQTATASSAGLFAAPAFVRGQNLNSKLQIAGIGCDGKGWSDIHEMSTHSQARLVAFCDVDLSRTAKVRKLNPEAPVFQDYRELLEKMGDKFDACTVSTPDHMHARIAIDAMRQGKHVYCQKPLSHNVWEARQMTLQAEKSGVITRMGNQIHSHKFYRTAVRAIQQGVIGKVKQVQSWCNSTGHGKSGLLNRPEHPVEPPSSLNWEQWIGVAPMRPYGGDKVYHPWGWRDWQDFGNGALGDFGCHILDPVFTALKINAAPLKLQARSSGMNNEVWPAQTVVDYVFPGTEFTIGKELSIRWLDGGERPSIADSHLPPNTGLPGSGSLFIGETGSLVLPHWATYRHYPAEGGDPMKVEQAEDLNHYHGWIDGCLSGQQPSDGFAYGGRLTEAVLLGNVAVRYPGQSLSWDADALQITNLKEANRWLTREYRTGWEIEPVAV